MDSVRRQLVDEHRRNKEEKQNIADLNYSGRSNNHIPIDLTAEILSKLPIKSIVRFTSVCKEWRDLITSSRFSSAHARDNSFYTVLATPSANQSDFHKSITLIQVSKNGDSSAVGSNFVRFGSRKQKLVVGSCNGLLCIVDRRSGLDRISILNPITNESTVVVHTSYVGSRNSAAAARYRFGYSPSTNEYKVFRRFVRARHGFGYLGDRCAILTVGVDKTWRDLPRGSFPAYMGDHVDRSVVPTSGNGAFHWLAGNNGGNYYSPPLCNFVLAFDIAEEKTRRIPFPRDEADQKHLRSVVCDDPLCLYYRERDLHTVLKMEDGDRWSRAVVPDGAVVRFGDGDFSISFIESLDRAVECGGVLFWVEGGKALRSYCPKSEEDDAVPFRRDDRVKLLCGFTPSLCSISEIMGKPSKSN